MEEKKMTDPAQAAELNEEALHQIEERMPDEDALYDLAELFKVFGDLTRIRILFVLFESEVSVGDLANIDLTPAADLEAKQAGKKPKRWKIRLLFPGG